MTDSLANEPPPLPAPPDMPEGMTPTIADMSANEVAPTPAGAAPRWLLEVALPFALGVVCVVSWAGTLILAAWDGLPFGELRAAQAASLLVVPALVIVVAVALNRSFWSATQRGQLGGALRLLLALAAIIVGLAPAFFAATPLPPDNNIGLLFFLPFAAPGFSLGVALGFAWGARPRPTGAGVGLMGGLGFAAPLVALAVTFIILANHPASQCAGSRLGCGGLAVAIDSILAGLLLIAGVFAVSLSFIGGILGAYLRRR